MTIDAHLHLDSDQFASPADAASFLDQAREQAGISHCVVLHLLAQGWSMEEFAEALAPFPRLHGMVNLNPSDKNCHKDLERAVNDLGYIGLKLHPRLQEFSVEEDNVAGILKTAGEYKVPVLIDGFPDGTHLQQGFHALKYAELARKVPDTNIIIGHMGGHHVLDFMMLAKRNPNIYFDISYSFLYYRGSSIPQNMIYAMKSMRFDRIFYGSDYPDRPLDLTLRDSLEIFNEHSVAKDDLDKILYANAAEFFGFPL